MTIKFPGVGRGPLSVLDSGLSGTIPQVDESGFGLVRGAPEHASFPSELLDIDHWVTFRAFDTEQVIRKADAHKIEVAFIALPIPGNLQTSYAVNYSEVDVGAVGMTMIDAANGDKNSIGLAVLAAAGAAAGAGISAALSKGNPAAAMTGAMTGASGAILGAAAGGNEAAQGIAAATAIGSTGDIGKVIGAQFGVARNPHKVVLFEGVGFRTHSFSYSFTPQSYKEAQTLKKIITMFKYFASPSFAGNKKITIGTDLSKANISPAGSTTGSGGKHLFKYPEYFEMDFHHPQFLFQIGASVLTNVDVNYQPAGIPSYAREGTSAPTPTQINFSLTFRETSIITKENIMSEGR